MNIGAVDLDKEILIIAEIGNNHEGSYALAEEMIGLAAETGVQAVKFQTFRTEHYVSRKDAERFARLKSFELGQAQFEKLAAYARKAGLIFISTPFDPESARFLSGIVSAYKISSSDNVFYPLLEEAAKGDKPVILSCGLAGLDDIAYSAAFLKRAWKQAGLNQELAALHCVTAYPVPPEEANLGAITAMKERLGLTVGYSDHTLGIDAAVLSAALGARIIEKHFTLNKQHSAFRDHQISADPAEMKDLVRKVREAQVLLGAGAGGARSGKVEKVLQPSELKNLTAVRRSIVAVRDLKIGEVVRNEDLTWIRPGGGLAPGNEAAILGRTLKRPIAAGDWITAESLS
jgi:N,N'-diacetyllegionaminate synthase